MTASSLHRDKRHLALEDMLSPGLVHRSSLSDMQRELTPGCWLSSRKSLCAARAGAPPQWRAPPSLQLRCSTARLTSGVPHQQYIHLSVM